MSVGVMEQASIYVTHLDRHRAHAARVIPEPGTVPASSVGARVANAVRGFWPAIEAVRTGLMAVPDTLNRVTLPVSATDADRRAALQAALDTAAADLRTTLGIARQAVEDARTIVIDAGMPPRPSTTDLAAQEAQISGLKADVKMTLDALEPRDVAPAVAAELAAAMSRDDALAVWLLGASGWAERYANVRGLYPHELESAVTPVLSRGDSEVATARQLAGAVYGSYSLDEVVQLAERAVAVGLQSVAATFRLAVPR